MSVIPYGIYSPLFMPVFFYLFICSLFVLLLSYGWTEKGLASKFITLRIPPIMYYAGPAWCVRVCLERAKAFCLTNRSPIICTSRCGTFSLGRLF